MDVKLIENSDGGDLYFNGVDLEIVEGFQNMPYLDMFGGNIESNTGLIVEGEQNFDWWGNRLFLEQQSNIQFNSDTERTLQNVSLTSSGRLQIESAVKSDLKNFSSFSTFTVSVSIISNDRVKIKVNIIEPSNLESTEFVYIWDETQKELSVL